MVSVLLVLAACGAAAAPGAASAAPTPVALQYKDSATYDGRPVAQYQTIEFRKTPGRALEVDPKEKLPTGMKYGFLQLGPTKDTAVVIAWAPKATDGPWLQLFSNADGKPIGARQKMSGKNLELPASIAVAVKPSEVRVERTLLFRRSAKGDGLRYAVRGYAEGRLKMGEKDFAALLIDGNGDGLLDSVGHDRLWLDLDGDKKFDLLTEQYPLGKAVSIGSDIFIVRSDPQAAAVAVNQRNIGESKLRVKLARKEGTPSQFSAEFVSDLGEFISVDKCDEFIAIPYGEYRVTSVSFAMTDKAGNKWDYRFYADETPEFSAPLGGEATIDLVKDFEMQVLLRGDQKVRPGTAISVTPHLVADHRLSLSSCDAGKEDGGKAEVLLIGPDGKTVHRTVEGFG